MRKRTLTKRISACVVATVMAISGLPQNMWKQNNNLVYAQSQESASSIYQEESYYYMVGNSAPGEWDSSNEENMMKETNIAGVYSIELTVPAFDEENLWNSRIAIVGRSEECYGEDLLSRILLGRPDIAPSMIEENYMECFSSYYVKCEEETKIVVYFDETTYAMDIKDSNGNDMEYAIVWCTNEDDEAYYTPEEFSKLTYKEYRDALNEPYIANELVQYYVASLPDFVMLEKQLEEKLSGKKVSNTTVNSIYGEKVELVAEPQLITGNNLSYQWYYNDNIISGKTQDTYEVTADYNSDYGYYCKVSNGTNEEIIYYNIILENILTLDYEQTISIKKGESVEAKVDATSAMSSEIEYEWYKYINDENVDYNYELIKSENNSNLLIEADENLASGYLCIVSDGIFSEEVYFDIDTGLTVEYEPEVIVDYLEEKEISIMATSEYSENIQYNWSKIYYNENVDSVCEEYLVEETGNSITIKAEAYVDRYECLVTDGIMSERVVIYVRINSGLDYIGNQNVVVKYNTSEELVVEAQSTTGRKIQYQWYGINEFGDYEIIDGATSSKYNVQNIKEDKEYICIIMDGIVRREIFFGVIADTELTLEYDTYVDVDYLGKKELNIKASTLAEELQYQWYKYYYDSNGESCCEELEGETKNILTITGDENLGYEYECMVTDGVMTEWACIHVDIDTGLEVSYGGELGVNYGGSIEVNVEAKSTAGRTIEYKWIIGNAYEDYVIVDGVNSSKYTITNVKEDMWCKCIVTDGIVKEIVYFDIYIDTGLSVSSDYSVTIQYHQKKELKVEAETISGGELKYQWAKYSINDIGETTCEVLEGETTNTLTIIGDENIGYEYECYVTDGFMDEWVYIEVTVINQEEVTYEWKHNENGWWYEGSDGSYPKNEWKYINEKWYHFNKYGYMQTGWYYENGRYYYLDTSGVMQASKWTKIGTKYYYFDASGVMQVNKWIQNKYYVKADGSMAVSEFVDNGRYYVDETGVWVTTTKWLKVNDNWYYILKGIVQKSKWAKVGAKYYYFDEIGVMQANKWIQNKYYVKADGSMAVSEFVDNGKYYVDETGAWVTTTKWLKVNDNWYYILNGTVQKSKWTKVGTKYYYFDEAGVMQANKWISGTYYVKADGSMAVSEWVDGGKYYVGSDGKWVKGA